VWAFPKNVRTQKYSEHIWAKKMFPLLYKHFEEVGNPVRYVEGQFIQENYAAVKEAYERLRRAMPDDAATKEAVKNAKTFKFHAEQGFTEVVHGQDYPNASKPQLGFFTFKIVKPGD
jgi:hypothetical protein